MTTQLSPGVHVTEIDLTTIVPAVATSEGAIAGVFRWGPVNQRVLVDNEQKLVTRFGKPTAINPETFFTASSFLSYGNRLYVVRAANTTGDLSASFTSNSVAWTITDLEDGLVNASSVANVYTVQAGIYANVARDAAMSAIAITADDPNELDPALFTLRNVLNEKDYVAKSANGDFEIDPELKWIAKYPGEMGNSLKISVCDSADAWFKAYPLTGTGINATASAIVGDTGTKSLVITLVPDNYANATSVATVSSTITTLHTNLTHGDILEVGNTQVGKQNLRITNVGALTDVYYSAAKALSFSNNSTLVTGTAPTISGIIAGSVVTGTGIAADTTVAAVINSTAVTLSKVTTSDSSGNYTVYNPGTFTVTVNNKIRTKTDIADKTVNRYWEYYGAFNRAPGQSEFLNKLYAEHPDSANGAALDELHIVVVDNKGLFTGVPGTVLERFAGLSRVIEAKDDEGASLWYADVINNGSQYVWFANDEDSEWGSANATAIVSATSTEAATYLFKGGSDGLEEDYVELACLYEAYDEFQNKNESDISLVLQGKARGGDNGQHLANYIIDNICEHRMDCVLFVSPDFNDVINNLYQEVDDVIEFRNSITNSSYAVMDTGYKYMYDRYNDVYRWVPLNGDIAGLCARTDDTNDPWWSPAGYNRGIIKNVAKLAYNPSQAERDSLYKSDVNPVINIAGSGTLLFGDKTLLGKPSAFDRINVRRLFIVLEKAIALAAKYTLFEFNDAFTRTQFRNLIEPYLRDVQGRRGIYDFKVVCDETNNTPEVIDSNRFIGDIYIKPARSINFIQLNFIAVRTGVSFNEIIGLRS